MARGGGRGQAHHGLVPVLTSAVVPAGRLSGQAQPTLHSDELVLRPWQLADVPDVVAAYQDPGVQRWHVRTMSTDEATAWVESWAQNWHRESAAGWAVTDGSRLLGRTGFRMLDPFEGLGEAAYWTTPAARGRGVAGRALNAVTVWMFTVGFHRLELQHSTANEASCRVAGKAAYEYEGTKRRHGLHTDGWHDMHVHARLND